MRKKAIAAVRRGERKKDVSQMWLNISRNTLDLWLKREEKTGDCRAVTNYQHQQGGGQKITDWERFRE
ncbi:MAG: IS630 family transposase, partial [Cyanobacteria bacterium SW_4_48_29]